MTGRPHDLSINKVSRAQWRAVTCACYLFAGSRESPKAVLQPGAGNAFVVPKPRKLPEFSRTQCLRAKLPPGRVNLPGLGVYSTALCEPRKGGRTPGTAQMSPTSSGRGQKWGKLEDKLPSTLFRSGGGRPQRGRGPSCWEVSESGVWGERG